MLEHVVEGCPCMGKRCTQCQELKCHGAFHKDSQTSKPVAACKECVNTKRRLKRQENLEETRAYHREYRRTHAEQLNTKNRQIYQEGTERRAQKAAYYRVHAESIKQIRKEYHQAHAQEIKAYKNARYQEKAEDFRQQKREYYQQNVASIRAAKREHRKTNPSFYSASDKAHAARRRALKMQADGDFSPQEWLDLKRRYNFTCLCCGKKEPEIRLTADHVIPLTGGGTNSIDNIQPLCFSCNSQKYTDDTDYRTGATPHE